MSHDQIGGSPAGAEPGSAPIIVRDADQRDLPAIAAIFNVEIAESAYVYAEAPLTLERFGYVEAARLTEVGRKFERWRTQLLLKRF